MATNFHFMDRFIELSSLKQLMHKLVEIDSPGIKFFHKCDCVEYDICLNRNSHTLPRHIMGILENFLC
jgi:hypothetical protein